MTSVTQADTGAVRLLTLNRPDRRNALDLELLRALTDIVSASVDDRTVHAVVLTGAGTAFCAGLDLKAIVAADWDPALWNRAYRLIRNATVPIIAAVNGVASTAGLALVLACDFAIAASSATFVDRHAAMGILSATGMSSELVDRIGIARAKQMWLSAESIDAQQALAWGLVNDVVADVDLVPIAMKRAQAIADLDRDYVRTLLATHDSGRAGTLQSHRELERTVARTRSTGRIAAEPGA